MACQEYSTGPLATAGGGSGRYCVKLWQVVSSVGDPASFTKAANSPTVTGYLPTANGRANVTTCCGPWAIPSVASLGGEPMVKLPPGTTTISGQFAHSRNESFGFSACC